MLRIGVLLGLLVPCRSHAFGNSWAPMKARVADAISAVMSRPELSALSVTPPDGEFDPPPDGEFDPAVPTMSLVDLFGMVGLNVTEEDLMKEVITRVKTVYAPKISSIIGKFNIDGVSTADEFNLMLLDLPKAEVILDPSGNGAYITDVGTQFLGPIGEISQWADTESKKLQDKITQQSMAALAEYIAWATSPETTEKAQEAADIVAKPWAQEMLPAVLTKVAEFAQELIDKFLNDVRSFIAEGKAAGKIDAVIAVDMIVAYGFRTGSKYAFLQELMFEFANKLIEAARAAAKGIGHEDEFNKVETFGREVYAKVSAAQKDLFDLVFSVIVPEIRDFVDEGVSVAHKKLLGVDGGIIDVLNTKRLHIMAESEMSAALQVRVRQSKKGLESIKNDESLLKDIGEFSFVLLEDVVEQVYEPAASDSDFAERSMCGLAFLAVFFALSTWA